MTSRQRGPLQEQVVGSHQKLDVSPAFQSSRATSLEGGVPNVTGFVGEFS